MSFASSRDAEVISFVHHREQSGLLSELGPFFLRAFFRGAIKTPQTFTFVYRKGGKMVGYVMVATHRSQALWQIVQSNSTGLVLGTLAGLLRKPWLIYKICQIPLQPKFDRITDCGEILALTVDRNYQRQGIGRKLFIQAQTELKKRNVKEFVVMTFVRLPKANAFYKAMGGKIILRKTYLGELVHYYHFKV